MSQFRCKLTHFMSQFLAIFHISWASLKRMSKMQLEKRWKQVFKNAKTAIQRTAVFIEKKLGSNLLSHKRTLHYHRRNCISLLCSEWEQVVLQHYGRQAYRVKKLKKYKLNQLVLIANSRCLPGLYGQDVQSISTGKLHTSRCFHIQPINVVVCNGLYWLIVRDDSSWGLLPA